MREARPAGKGQSNVKSGAGANRHDVLLRALLETAVDGIVVIGELGAVQIFNSACERLFGYDSGEVEGRNVSMLMPEPYRSAHDGYIAHFRDTGEKRIIGIGREVRGLRKDGSDFPMYLSVGEGHIDGERFFVGIIHDLSAIREEQHRRQAADRHLAAIVESSDDIILSMDLAGRVTTWNEAATRIYGYGPHEMIGELIDRIIPADRRNEEQEILDLICKGKKISHYETARLRKDGSEVLVSLALSPIFDAGGRIIGAAKIARDVTEERRREAETARLRAALAHAARLDAMGQLSASLAHELNQPLAATMNYANAARRLLATKGGGEKAAPLLDKAVAQVVRAGQIIQRLRSFVEKREFARAREDINDIVREAVALGYVGMADDGVVLRTELADGLPPIYADRVQIQQVLVNLLRNAGEAMRDRPVRLLSVSTYGPGEALVGVTVADSGPGLPQEVAEQLFKPFVTTKEQGMGVGLSICRTIVEAHQGRIWTSAPAGGGTAFHFELPAGGEP
ncbi:MAG TPA: PAS domain S-box protein [Rhizomicrobium sp.]|nr:PAS domain S-box protein [Rhizomicrobium sp.]